MLSSPGSVVLIILAIWVYAVGLLLPTSINVIFYFITRKKLVSDQA
jgi:hypothetical protein